ncbi:molybdopterin molybdotransferase MoeA [Zafaria sp. Z1313]|uniref:molybdopterin molybdotransferase MoeA n=1 Tax=unclassified Zafaria TaxID=2828765 RepID=UPI002E788A99|nr:molybdopterin-binding protein [Zafaria sp. J156]MEE1622252.1 molybdopterin-binding protein [Zafaria sp. J156]
MSGHHGGPDGHHDGSDWDDARRIAYDAGARLRERLPPAEELGLGSAAGRVLARDVRALHALPHYASSAMDGWAVAGAGPWRVRPTAGPRHDAGEPLAPGWAAPIVTGGALPEGTTAVLRSERGRIEGAGPGGTAGTGGSAGGLLAATEDVPVGADIRPAATEAVEGSLLLRAGSVLTPAAVAVAALAGHDGVPVAARPSVRLVMTGGEVETHGLPAPGRVRDAFGPVLPSCLAALGAGGLESLRIGDDATATRRAISGGGDVVVTTGGTGRSEADHVRRAALDEGAVLLVDQVAMRPGHPALLARFPDGRLLAALPGNPLAALAAVATLLEPLLRAAGGRPASYPLPVRSAAAWAPLPRRHRLVPARWTDGPGSALEAADHTGPAMMRGLAAADAFLVLPPEGVPDGGTARCVPLPWMP